MSAVAASPVMAHDCFNRPRTRMRPRPAATTRWSASTPTATRSSCRPARARGIGGFAAIAPGVFGPDQTETLYAHTIGNSSSHEVVGGPGSQKPSHACDGKGIDYIDACFGE
jgi:hypothetical protein